MLPPLPLTVPAANPIGGGLYSAATVIDAGDGHHAGGLLIESVNTGAHGLWDPSCTPETPNEDKAGPRREPTVFSATGVWAADECLLVGVEEQAALDRASQTLRLTEPVDVEKHAAGLLNAVDLDESASGGLEEAIGYLDNAVNAGGAPGVLHASRRLIGKLKGFIVRQGNSLFTPAGNRWAFGAGYDALGDAVIGTGAVVVRRSPVTLSVGLHPMTNKRAAIAERIVAVGWEGPTARVSLTPTQ